ncbi:MAG TPA: OmpA family protein [Alphaproteobacteria bacterium]|nr:OmpA family protein [Alphaproteobacteria bacterium]MCB9984447.1 OmpA family protein [Micavibrio sp.]HPQ50104.1 OmpA family protein [Alphaproteobacteria bacterium]HRK97788.1 OmpA family protein [Alphaproteobacteria bacterium]
MKSIRGIALLTLITATSLIVSGCSGFKSQSEVEALNEAQAVGSPFTQALASEYRDMANREQNVMFDYPDALHFARKGLAAASGEIVLPEPVSDWNLKPEHIEELSGARAKLMSALDRGAREANPSVAAVAQARFDCWIEQQEENWQKEDISGCKSQFLEALNTLGGDLAPPPEDVMPPVTAIAPPLAPMAAEDAKYLVFFDFDSSKVDNGGSSVLDSVAAEIKKQNISAVAVTGYTDTSGSKKYNKRLSAKRANSVRDGLISRGVPASMLKVDSMGEENLMVPTADEVREPANRRTEITFEK